MQAVPPIPNRGVARADRMAILSRGFNVLVCTALLVLVLPVPLASAATNFTEEFEAGATGWTVTGSTAAQDCAVKQSGLCSLRLRGPNQYSYVDVRKTITPAIGLTGIVTATIWFRTTSTENYVDTGFGIEFNDGSNVELYLHPSDDWYGLRSSYSGESSAVAYATLNAWYRAEIEIWPGFDKAWMRVYTPYYTDSSHISISPTATSISSLHLWGNGRADYHYDALTINTEGSVPGTPTGVSVQNTGNAGELKVSWNAPASNVPAPHGIEHYRIYRSTSATGPFEYVGYTYYTDPEPRAYTDCCLEWATTYHYKVSAYNVVGEGGQSVAASATTWGSPSAPTLVATIGPNLGQITLNWQAPQFPNGPIHSYAIYRGFSSGSESYFGMVGNVLKYTDATCPALKACFYTVRAINVIAWGAFSNEASAPGTAIPQGLDALNLLTDTDGDGFSNADEIHGNSDPSDLESTPNTDDDCDGKPNRQEGDVLAAQGIGHPVVTVTGGGVNFDPNTLALDVDPPALGIRQEGSSSC